MGLEPSRNGPMSMTGINAGAKLDRGGVLMSSALNGFQVIQLKVGAF
jgi:hypothetical protein